MIKIPNWCYNYLEVSGPTRDLRKLVDQVKGTDTALDFNNVIPYPKKFRDLDENSDGHFKGFNSGGYQWCVDNWGTKWNVDADIQGEPIEKGITFTFDTAWGPSVLITKKLGKLYPKLRFFHKYSEPGMCFYGTFEVKNGKVVQDECLDMPTYKCKNCGSEQTMEPDEVDCQDCWDCQHSDWEEVKKGKKGD